MKRVYCLALPEQETEPVWCLGNETVSPGDWITVSLGKGNCPCRGHVIEVQPCNDEDIQGVKEILSVESGGNETPYIPKEDMPYSDDLMPSQMKREDRINLALQVLEGGNPYEAYEWALDNCQDYEDKEIMLLVRDCFQQAMKAEIPEAALELGILYYTGTEGIEQDYKKAAEYYEIAASQGSMMAMCNLGYCYYYGRHQPVDYEKAYQCFAQSAMLDNNPNAFYKVGDMYMDGIYVERNERIGAKMYLRAAEYSNSFTFCRPDIDMRLGTLYTRGLGVPEDQIKALDYYFSALYGFYMRIKTDPFANDLIESVKEKIRQARELLAEEQAELMGDGELGLPREYRKDGD